MGALVASLCGGAFVPAAIAGPFPGCDATSLQNADLSGCDLRGATVSNVSIGVPSKVLNLTNANLAGLDLTTVRTWGVTMNLTGANLSGAKLGKGLGDWTAPCPFLAGKGLKHNFSGTNLSNSFLSRCSFQGQDLKDANLSGATLDLVGFSGANLSRVTLSGSSYSNLGAGAPASLPSGWSFFAGILKAGTLHGVNLSGKYIGGGKDADLTDANLTGARLELQFERMNLTRANMRNSLVEDLEFADGSLAGADFTGATVAGVTLARVNVTGTKFGGAAMFDGVNASGLIGTPASLPSGWRACKGMLFGPMVNPADNADLSGCVLADANLTDADMGTLNLSSADLTGVDGGGTALPTDPASAAAAAAAAVPRVKRGVKFFKTKLTGANLKNAKLRFAGLAGVVSGGIKGTPASLPVGWRLTAGFLVGPKANLAGATVSGADFSNIDFSTASLAGAKLTGVYLAGAKLSKANLTGVTSSGLTGTPANLPTGWKITGGKLVKG